jgi:HAD superfamily hydrolase (TIGR01509 family)
MRAVEAVVFDLDGTLVRSELDYGEMARRVKQILIVEGVPESELDEPRKIWPVIRGGEEPLKELGLSTERVKPVLGLINEALNAVEALSLENVEPMPGALETLRCLRERGLRIGVATRGGSPYARRSLELTGLTELVDVVLARDEVDHPKPDPRHLLQVIRALNASPQGVIYIGDTTTDLSTAKEAGIAFIGYAGNENWAKRMREAGCRTFVSDLLEIVKIVEEGLNPSNAN